MRHLGLIIIAAPVVGMMVWLSSRPSWEISARNSPQGIILDVYKSNATQPTYTTVLKGQRIHAEVERVGRLDLPVELAKTTFVDETLRPGRWTLVLNGTEIDIMERALIVNGSTEIAPRE